MGKDVVDICKLCRKKKKLCHSHIIPEYMYKTIYDEKHRAIKIQDTIMGKKGFLQKGHRAYILCPDCEQYVNENIEQPFLNLWQSSRFPERVNTEQYVVINNLKYDIVKLFVLLNLWRAEYDSVIGANVSLGYKHEAQLRRMIKSLNPGKLQEYPVWGNLLIDSTGKVERGIICNYGIAKFDGHHVYYAAYGGIEWYTKCSSHPWDVCSRICMRENGDLLLGVEAYEKSNAVMHFVRMATEIEN